MIRLLNKAEMKEVYEKYMIHDFPQNELKPLIMLEEPYYFCYGYYEEEKLMGYAVLVVCEKNQCLLLDYFAVLSAYRSKGTGTRFLLKLKEMCKAYKTIFIESEAENSIAAIRRIEFYKHASAKQTSLTVRLYGVDYRILMIPLQEDPDDQKVQMRIDEIYKMIYDPSLLDRYLEYQSER